MVGPILQGIGRALGPSLARLWGAASWASLGWVLSDLKAFFGAPEEDANGSAKASQRLIGAAFVVGALLVWPVESPNCAW